MEITIAAKVEFNLLNADIWIKIWFGGKFLEIDFSFNFWIFGTFFRKGLLLKKSYVSVIT